MKNEKEGDSLRREAIPSTSIGPEQQMAESPGFFKERPLPRIELAPRVLRNQTRRDVLLFGVGSASRRWVSAATSHTQSHWHTSKYEFSWEEMVSEQSTAYRR
jgi:hypothetical protein